MQDKLVRELHFASLRKLVVARPGSGSAPSPVPEAVSEVRRDLDLRGELPSFDSLAPTDALLRVVPFSSGATSPPRNVEQNLSPVHDDSCALPLPYDPRNGLPLLLPVDFVWPSSWGLIDAYSEDALPWVRAVVSHVNSSVVYVAVPCAVWGGVEGWVGSAFLVVSAGGVVVYAEGGEPLVTLPSSAIVGLGLGFAGGSDAEQCDTAVGVGTLGRWGGPEVGNTPHSVPPHAPRGGLVLARAGGVSNVSDAAAAVGWGWAAGGTGVSWQRTSGGVDDDIDCASPHAVLVQVAPERLGALDKAKPYAPLGASPARATARCSASPRGSSRRDVLLRVRGMDVASVCSGIAALVVRAGAPSGAWCPPARSPSRPEVPGDWSAPASAAAGMMGMGTGEGSHEGEDSSPPPLDANESLLVANWPPSHLSLSLLAAVVRASGLHAFCVSGFLSSEYAMGYDDDASRPTWLFSDVSECIHHLRTLGDISVHPAPLRVTAARPLPLGSVGGAIGALARSAAHDALHGDGLRVVACDSDIVTLQPATQDEVGYATGRVGDDPPLSLGRALRCYGVGDRSLAVQVATIAALCRAGPAFHWGQHGGARAFVATATSALRLAGWSGQGVPSIVPGMPDMDALRQSDSRPSRSAMRHLRLCALPSAGRSGAHVVGGGWSYRASVVPPADAPWGTTVDGLPTRGPDHVPLYPTLRPTCSSASHDGPVSSRDGRRSMSVPSASAPDRHRIRSAFNALPQASHSSAMRGPVEPLDDAELAQPVSGGAPERSLPAVRQRPPYSPREVDWPHSPSSRGGSDASPSPPSAVAMTPARLGAPFGMATPWTERAPRDEPRPVHVSGHRPTGPDPAGGNFGDVDEEVMLADAFARHCDAATKLLGVDGMARLLADLGQRSDPAFASAAVEAVLSHVRGSQWRDAGPAGVSLPDFLSWWESTSRAMRQDAN